MNFQINATIDQIKKNLNQMPKTPLTKDTKKVLRDLKQLLFNIQQPKYSGCEACVHCHERRQRLEEANERTRRFAW